jgi:hypothetical protein
MLFEKKIAGQQVRKKNQQQKRLKQEVQTIKGIP